jgi:hypothetical protein
MCVRRAHGVVVVVGLVRVSYDQLGHVVVAERVG